MADNRDKTTDQMKTWKENRGSRKPDVLTTGAGRPIGDKLNLQTAGPRGPLLVQDVVFTDEMAHFDRERIPERVVHAKGAGAFGYFEVTHDITRYCKAKVFEHIGKTTPIAVRFSTVGNDYHVFFPQLLIRGISQQKKGLLGRPGGHWMKQYG